MVFMGRRRSRRWKAFAWFFVTSLGALFYSIRCSNAASDSLYSSEQNHIPGDEIKSHVTRPESGSCKNRPPKQKFLIVVSTLDGKLSALDAADHGRVHWTVSTDPRPLLSSSISNLDINQNGVRKRLIPSLDGTLYQYDGDSIEAIPMTAEALLSSSFKLSDRTMMVGGKDISSFGIDPVTGKLRYFCTSEGCKILDSDDQGDRDMLVVTKSMQTVRSVDPRSGIEKWNFSVGSHQIEMIPGDKSHDATPLEEEDDICSQTCPNEETHDMLDTDDSIKIIVPEGMVVALSPENPDVVDWKHKFESPVAKAWILRNGVLKSISVFDNKHIPALSGFEDTGDVKDPTGSQPLLYVGLHQNQLYVQPSVPMQENVANAAHRFHGSALSVPKVTWKPLISTAPSRTPIFRGNRQDPSGPRMIANGQAANKETGLSVWHENYPFDNGYYLYPDVILPANICEAINKTEESMPHVIYMSLWNYWKEVLAISILTSVCLNLTILKLRKVYKKKCMSFEKEDSLVISGTRSVEELDTTEKRTDEYESRYKTDFEQLQVLGKGGFGIVFEARNKVDECCYAIKRITLPINEVSRLKMKREVFALAKLDHPGIVRYFQAWEETPPVGWQENKDQEMFESECISMPTPCNSTTHFAPKDPNTHDSIHLELNDGIREKSTINQFGGGINDDRYIITSNERAGGSQEFSVSTKSLSWEKSEDSRRLFGQRIEEESSSLDVEFNLDVSDDSDDSGSFANTTVPFSKLTNPHTENENDSFSIVFEDSGCADKSGKSSRSSSSGGIVFQDDSNHSNRYIVDIPSESGGSRPKTLSLSDQKSHSARKLQLDKSTPTQRSYLYIQMQLCRRETLKDWLCASTCEPRSSEVIWDMFGQIVSAVEYVHNSGLMHRDLKPSNIFFSYDEVIKIGDFGLATDLTEEIEDCSADSNPFRKHTAQVGTTLYMSPEQMAGKPYGPKVDIFSLGMILFEMLYFFNTQMERVRTLMEIKKRIFPEEFKKNQEEYKFVDWLLSFEPAQRPSATEIMNSKLLEKFRSQHPPKIHRDRSISSSSSGSLAYD
ncbi:eukaryotic translation initiation factor 2-alpha kinase 3-like [Saccostrea echinata]|uniref:eukaryotic translation initiation factor 2-alpha kinase 3-like n=1 Tax=Saccostrea echinata TaxID=191078 RepID=UPI002A82F416|nr:eukaryotic translation initiation factor 2-alpha kinase 3-like [Saccostrea echinata]